MGLCQYVYLCFHALSLPCSHTFWHAIPTSFYIFNVFLTLVQCQLTIMVAPLKEEVAQHRRRNRGHVPPPPMFHKLLYKLLTTLCVVSDCAPPQSKSLSYASAQACCAQHSVLLRHKHMLEKPLVKFSVCSETV